MKQKIRLSWGIIFFALAGTVWGDVTIESTYKTSGIKGMGEAQGTAIHRYQRDKKWESQTTRFTGAILSLLVKEGENITITRVDKGLSWTLDTKNKTYLEAPLVAPTIQPEEREPKDKKTTTRITKSEFTVKKSGAKETINGFPCEEYLLIWLLEIEDLETKEKTRSTMTTGLWTTPETTLIRKVRQEETAFEKALAKKLGMELSQEEAKKMGLAAMGAFMKTSAEEMRKGMIRVKNEISKIQGYPIRTTISWNLEGEKGPGRPQEDKASKPPERSEGVGSLLGGFMSRLVQKKSEDKGPGDEGQGSPFFSTTIEVKSMDAGTLPAETFEIPEGFVKK